MLAIVPYDNYQMDHTLPIVLQKFLLYQPLLRPNIQQLVKRTQEYVQ